MVNFHGKSYTYEVTLIMHHNYTGNAHAQMRRVRQKLCSSYNQNQSKKERKRNDRVVHYPLTLGTMYQVKFSQVSHLLFFLQFEFNSFFLNMYTVAFFKT